MSYNKIFIILLIIVVISGLFMFHGGRTDTIRRDTETVYNEEEIVDMISENESAPSRPYDILIKLDDKLIIIRDDGVFAFRDLDEYIQYLDDLRTSGVGSRPTFYLQKEINTQGRVIFRKRENPFSPDGGEIIMEGMESANYIDSSDDNPPYNANQYQGFDAHGLHVGVRTKIDDIQLAGEENGGCSDSPMDHNWCGVIYTQEAIKSGKYNDRTIVPYSYFQPRTVFLPMFGSGNPSNAVNFALGENRDFQSANQMGEDRGYNPGELSRQNPPMFLENTVQPQDQQPIPVPVSGDIGSSYDVGSSYDTIGSSYDVGSSYDIIGSSYDTGSSVFVGSQ